MDAVQVFALAALQGLTEFLPISSSAHLILLPAVVRWPDQGLNFDVAVHVGTLLAVLAYFRHELARMSRGWWRSVATRQLDADARLAWAVLVSTIPVGLAGLAVALLGTGAMRSPFVIAIATIAFALLLWWADARGTRTRTEQSIGWREVLVVGCAQALALIPGASRSGVTITAGLALGLTREAAARFSFLLSIPVIALAGGLKAALALSDPTPIPWSALLAGALISAVIAYATIHCFLRLLERIGFLPFVIYRLGLGVVLLVIVW